MKQFLTLDQQIDLMKSRGMTFTNIESSRNFLLRKNYYNTTNVYGKYFVKEKGHNDYKDGTTFDDIIYMYEFEKKIRDQTFILIMNLEANISSTVAYKFSKKFPEKNSYLQINNFCPSCMNKNLGGWSFLQSRISKMHSDSLKFKNKNLNSISHNLIKYKYVPFWVLINEFTFGNLIALFRLIDIDLKQEITNSFSRLLTLSYGKKVHLTPSEMQSYLDTISDFRNKIAHDACLSVYRTRKGTHPQLNALNKIEYENPNESRRKFYDVLLLSRFFVSKPAYYSVIDEIIDSICILENQLNDKSVMNDFMDDLGFNFYT